MHKKQRFILKRQNIFHKKLKKPARTFLEIKNKNKVFKKIHLFARHYNIGAFVINNKLSFVGTTNLIEKLKLSEGKFASFSIKKII